MEELKVGGAGGALCPETEPVLVKQEPSENGSNDSHGSDVQPHDLVVAELGDVEQSAQPEATNAMGMPEFVAVRVKQEPVDMEEAAGLQDAMGTNTGHIKQSAQPRATKTMGMPEFTAVRVKQEPADIYTQMEEAIHRGLQAERPQDVAAGSRGDVGEQDSAGSQDAGTNWEAVFVKQEPVDEDEICRSTVPGQSQSELVFTENRGLLSTVCIKVEIEFDGESGTGGSGASETARGTLQGARVAGAGTVAVKRPPRPARPPQPSECDICHRKVTSLSKLKEHMRTHTGEKPYRCETCNKGFTQMSHLKKHVRIHTGEKPYTCEMCKKDFTLLDSLKIHQRIHTGEKPYSCKMCEKKFGDLSTLKRHGRIHTQEKPYTCSICKKAFAQLGSLKVHERSHTGEKPYECEVCNKKFSESGTLKRHERIHTGEKPYSCEICERAFTELGCLNKHRRTHNKVINSVSVEWDSESRSGDGGMAIEFTEDAELKTP